MIVVMAMVMVMVMVMITLRSYLPYLASSHGKCPQLSYCHLEVLKIVSTVTIYHQQLQQSAG